MISAGGQSGEWVLPAGQVQAWFDGAAAGETLVYAHGFRLLQGDTASLVRRLALSGLVDPVQPRAGDGRFNYVIQKRSSSMETRAERVRDAEAEDEALDAIFRALKRAANMGLPAPSNTELARSAGLATRDQAAWRVAKLIQKGLIRSMSVTSGPQAGARVITIVSSGRRTAAPESWQQAARDVRRENVR